MQTVPNVVTVDLDAPSDVARTQQAGVADRLLDALDRSGTRCTFFVPRSLAETDPALPRRIVERGHEVACLTDTPLAKARPYCSRFAGELESTRAALESAAGVRVRGHRNRTLSVDYESEWVYDVLVDRGFEYDSSRIPPARDEEGRQPVPKAAHAVWRWGGTLIELPVSMADALAMRVRLGAAGTIRGLPLPVWSALVSGRRARGEPVVVHVRASELGPATTERVGHIVSRIPFTSVANALPELYRHAPIVES